MSTCAVLFSQETFGRQSSLVESSLDLVELIVESLRNVAALCLDIIVVISAHLSDLLLPEVDAACEKLKAAGARRALRLPVGGAFHSPLMEPARAELAEAIAEAPIHTPVCPIYQNVDAKPRTDPAVIRENLIAQLTAPVRWTQIVRNMLADGATEFTELGPGNVLQGLIKKVDAEAAAESRSTL